MNRVCQTAFRRKHNRPRRGLSRPPAELVVEPMAVIRENNDGADVPVVIENTRICKEMQKAESYKMLMVQ